MKLLLAASLTALATTATAGVQGPIKVSKDGRHFIDKTGAPFFWLGDTAWPLFAQYSTSQAEAYLTNRGEKGFTVIQDVLAWGLLRITIAGAVTRKVARISRNESL